jgi:hypothetical protein
MPTEVSFDLIRLKKPFRQNDLTLAVSRSIGDTARGTVVPPAKPPVR